MNETDAGGHHAASHRAADSGSGGDNRRGSRRAVAAVVLTILAIAFAGIALIAAHSEQTSYFDRSTPPQYVHVTQGKSYLLSIHGGADTLAAQGLEASSLKCQYATSPDGTAQSLTVSALASDSRAVNSVATIDAPLTGNIRVTCSNFTGNVYLDGADSAPFDLAGLYILLCVITLTFGLALGIAAIRGTTSRQNEDDEPAVLQELVP
jgi:hypothetical protein